jgi:LPXTG-motif cell wall-anchored protein
MTTLPKTASSTPLVALLGALALAGASAVRFGRKAA